MQLKFVAPNQEKTFGEMTFAGEGREITQFVNGMRRVVARTYHFYSDAQKADALEVRIPGKAGLKSFEYEQPIKLVKPRITISGYAIGGRGYTNYSLSADDIAPAEDYDLVALQ